MRAIALLVAAATLAGCASSPDYYRFTPMPGAVQAATLDQSKARCSMYIREQARHTTGIADALFTGTSAPTDYEDCMKTAGWIDANHLPAK